MDYDKSPEHVQLAVELIRQVENAMFTEDTVVEAAILVIQDTLNKLQQDERLVWRNRLSHIFELPASINSNNHGSNVNRKSH